MIGDLLLTWISETGSGSVSDFRSRASWLARTENMDVSEYLTGRWLRVASALGHCEVDWHRGTWAVAPPVIASLPLADGLAVLAGSRRPRLMRAIEEADIYIELVRRPDPKGEIPAAATLLIPFEHVSELDTYASAIGARHTEHAAVGIADVLPAVAPSILAAPPAYNSILEQLVDFSPRSWTSASPSSTHPSQGLYRERFHGRWLYKFRKSDDWYSCDVSSGVFAELARRGESAIRWRPADANRAGPGTIFIDRGAPLPSLHARALTLCSGFPPRVGSAAETAIYDNVPHEIATRVSVSLGQQLQISD